MKPKDWSWVNWWIDRKRVLPRNDTERERFKWLRQKTWRRLI